MASTGLTRNPFTDTVPRCDGHDCGMVAGVTSLIQSSIARSERAAPVSALPPPSGPGPGGGRDCVGRLGHHPRESVRA